MTEATPRKPERRVRVRIAISMLVASLMMLSLMVLGFYFRANNLNLARDLEAREIEALLNRAEAQLRQVFDHGPILLEKYDHYVAQHMISHDNLDDLGLYLANELRSEDAISQINFARFNDGSAVGVSKQDRQLHLYQLDRTTQPGHTITSRVLRDDRRMRLSAASGEVGDPRTTQWFNQAVASHRTIWTGPYQVTDADLTDADKASGEVMAGGRTRLIASRAVYDHSGNQVRGVFGIDYGISAIDRLLTDAIGEDIGQLSVVFPVAGTGLILGDLDASVRATLAAHLEVGKSAITDRQTGAPVSGVTIVEYADHHLVSRAITFGDNHPATIVYLFDPAQSYFGVVERETLAVLIGFAIFSVLGLLAALLVSRSIARPIELMGLETNEISLDDLSASKPFSRHWLVEIDDTKHAFNNMLTRLDKEQRIRETFGRYIPDQLASALETGLVGLEFGGSATNMTAIFTDVESFTSLSEDTAPEVLVTYLNQYLDTVFRAIQAHDGLVIDIIGDGIFAVFGAPHPQDNHRDLALAAARAVAEASERFKAQLNDQGIAWGRTRIGVHTGSVIVGNMGGPGQQKYTAIGDVINATSRIEGMNKILGTGLLASGATITQAANADAWRLVGHFVVKGKTAALDIYQYVGEDYDQTQAQAFTACLTSAKQDPGKALAAIEDYTQQYGPDPVLDFYRQRLQAGDACDTIVLTSK